MITETTKSIELPNLAAGNLPKRQIIRDYTFYRAAVPTYVGGDMAFGWGSDEPSHRMQTLESLIKGRIRDLWVNQL